MLAVQGAVFVLFWMLSIAAFAFEIWALIDAARTPPGAFASAGKLTKQKWLLILVVAVVVGLSGAAGYRPLVTSFLPIVAFIAAAVYMADVRPAVRPYRGRGGSGGGRSGPYGPW